MKNVLQTQGNDDLMYEDDEPKIEELQYKELLDISFFSNYFDQTFRYFSKINCNTGTNSIIYYVHIILSFIQLVSPCFLLNSVIIWKDDNIVSFLLQVVCSISRGWYSENDERPRRIITTCAIFIIFAFNVLLDSLKRRFLYRKVISNREANISISVFKYLLPHLTPLLLCGFPSALRSLINGHHNFVNYFDVIGAPIIFVFEQIKLTCISERVLIENQPSFTWDSKWHPITITIICINAAFDSAIIPPEKAVFRIILMFLLFLSYLLTGIAFSLFIPHISHNFSFAISAICLSCSITVLVGMICTITNAHLSYFIIVVFVVLLVVFYFMNSALTHRSLMKITNLFDEMHNYPDCERDLFHTNFKTHYHFIRAAHITFPYWDPYLLSWRPFRLALEIWPENRDILFLWSKMVAIFPHEANLFQQVTNTFQQNSKMSLTYRLQLRFIVHSRITSLIPSLRASLASFEKSSDYVKQMHRRFFENILSKNISFFWRDVNDISKQVIRLEMAIKQLVDAYPNNIDVIQSYLKFLGTIKIDPYELREWGKKLDILKSGGKLRHDLAYTAALPMYPQLSDMCAQTDCADDVVGHNSQTIHGHPSLNAVNSNNVDDISHPINTNNIDINNNMNINDNNNDDNLMDELYQQIAAGMQPNVEGQMDEYHLQFALVQLIKHSKIGGIIVPSTFIVLGTVVVLIVFSFFLNKFSDDMITTFVKITDTMKSIDYTILNLARLGLFASQTIFLLSPNSNPIDRIAMMDLIAPNLYARAKLINLWDFKVADVISLASTTRSQIEQLTSSFTLFDLNSPSIKNIYNELFVKVYKDDLTRQMYTTRVINDLISLLKNSPNEIYNNDQRYVNFRTTLTEVYPEFAEIAEVIADAFTSSVHKTMDDINNLLILSLGLDLLFISVPFIICQFSLGILSDAIAAAYSAMPNTTIREVITRYSRNTKNDACVSGPTTRIILPTNGNERHTLYVLIYTIPFMLTFAVLFACSFYIYFVAFDMTNFGNYHIKVIQYIALPLSHIYYSMFMLTEVYNTKFMYTTNEITSYFIDSGKNNTKIANLELANGLWGDKLAMKLILDDPPIERVWNERKNTIYTNLERLILSSFLNGIDTEIAFLMKTFESCNTMLIDDQSFMELSYFTTNWAISNRDDPYIDSISGSVSTLFSTYKSHSQSIFISVLIVQIAVAIFAIVALCFRLSSLKMALHFFLFFRSSSILQNPQITTLLTEGKMKTEEISNKFKNSEDILLKIPEAIVLVNRDLTIYDNNSAFNRLISTNDDVTGKNLTDFMGKSEKTDFNIDHFEVKLNDVLNGNEEPNFTMSFSFLSPHQKNMYIMANVICLTDTGAVRSQSQNDEITSIAIVIDDLTSQMQRWEKMKSEQAKTRLMLEKIMPLPIVDALQNGTTDNGSISFSVQSITVGCILVETDPFIESENGINGVTYGNNNNSNCSGEVPFRFYNSVFAMFEENMKGFPILAKVKTMMNVYTFAGGLFSSQNKPEKHGEDAIRYALHILSIQPKIEEAMKRRVSLTIGVNSGGPAVAGILSINRPSFQLVGNVVETAQYLADSGAPGQIHISRNVYELIYAFNFNVQEKGENMIGNGIVARTYIVSV